MTRFEDEIHDFNWESTDGRLRIVNRCDVHFKDYDSASKSFLSRANVSLELMDQGLDALIIAEVHQICMVNQRRYWISLSISKLMKVLGQLRKRRNGIV